MRAACLRLGNLANQTELGRDVGMAQATVHRHLDLLEVSYQLVRLPAFAVNRTSRLIKTPKLYWNDTALALHLAGEDEPRRRSSREPGPVRPAGLERVAARRSPGHVLANGGGREVDFVIEWKGKLLPIEVKATPRPRTGDADNLRAFRTSTAAWPAPASCSTPARPFRGSPTASSRRPGRPSSSRPLPPRPPSSPAPSFGTWPAGEAEPGVGATSARRPDAIVPRW